MILCISVLSVVISPFSFQFCWFDFSPFVSWWVWLMVCQFYLSSQRTSFWLFDFCYGLFCFFCIYFALIFKISFLLLTQGFFLSSFSSCFRCRVRLFIWLFLFVSWGKPVLLWTFPLALLLQCPIGFGLLCFHFSSFLCIFWFLFFFISSVICWLFSTCCSTSICWNF